MSCSYLSFNHVPKALPCPSPPINQSKIDLFAFFQQQRRAPYRPHQAYSDKQASASINWNRINQAVQVGGVLLSNVVVAHPVLAETGVNYEEDLVWILIQSGISAFLYFILFPPIIMNWLRIRWYKRNLLEMYVQFMFVFLFFPGLLLWAPFLNFRKFPRDPSMKYPWSTPQDPSQVRGGFLKYPWAGPEDYE